MSTLYDLITVLPVSVLAMILFGGKTGMPEESLPGYAVCMILSLVVVILINMKRKNRIRGIGIVAVFLVGLCIAVGEENRQRFLNEYFWVLHIVCLTAVSLAAGILMRRNVWVGRAAAAALLIFCAVGAVLEWDISKEAFALICFILLVQLAGEIQRYWRKSGCCDMKDHITRISPMILALCLTVWLIPAPDEPYDWQLAKDIINGTAACINRIYGFFTHPSDDYGSVGFSDSGGFLAALSGSDEEVMRIEAGNTTIKDMRLVGCISGDFTGREWVFDTAGESNTRMTDTLETSCAVRKYDPSSQSDYLQKTDMYCVSYLYNTKYVFSPAKIRLEATIEKNDNKTGISEKNGSIVSEHKFGYNDSYTVSCYVFNYGSPDAAELLDNAEEISEAEWDSAAKAESVYDKPGYTFGDYLNYRGDVYGKYCHSFGVSEEVAEILEGIKNSSSGRYETMKKLETYLKGLEYSTNCGALPDSVSDAGSFLDYFLLDSKKGYCMHFATAFALMANELGVPCRYVQGYNVRRDISGDIIVKQSDAHAWPEVYFDNAGWVAFEPTPGYSVPKGWGARDAFMYEDDDTENGQDETEGEDDLTVQEAVTLDPLIFVIPSAAVLVFLLVVFVISRSVSRKKYSEMNCRDRFVFLTQQNFRLLGHLGFRPEKGETLSELIDRITASDRPDIKENIGFIRVYESALYSDREITEKDVRSAEDIHSALRGLVKKSSLKYRLLLLITE
ncbi:MAG: hypothetical protein IK093_18540 [Ruminiclostridium sp.]|nr:hypothetical protein [Ruminiclostridium sp.]